MRNKRRHKSIVIFIGLATVCMLLAWIHRQGLKENAEEQRMELPIESASRVSMVDDEAVVALDSSTLAISGITVKPLEGVEAPYSGVVWLNGKAWIYVEREAGRFVRREVAPDPSSDSPRFLFKTPVHGTQAVVIGAQLLLSEEFRSQIQLGEVR